MTVLMTGATGLVGERLLPRLIESGEDCRVLVRPGKNGPAGVQVIEGDLLDPASLADAVAGVSAILHLAAVFRTQDTNLIWRSNLEGTRSLIAAAQAHAPGARFIVASTSNVYSRNSPQPGRETDAVDPQDAYPASKVMAERALRESGLNWTILRFPFVYGDGDGHLENVAEASECVRLSPSAPDEHNPSPRYRDGDEHGLGGRVRRPRGQHIR